MTGPAGRDDSALTASQRLVDWEGGGPSSAHNATHALSTLSLEQNIITL